MVYRLKTENPGKEFFPVKDTALCRNMKKITLDKVLDSLENTKHRVTVPADIASRASRAISRMVEIG